MGVLAEITLMALSSSGLMLSRFDSQALSGGTAEDDDAEEDALICVSADVA